MWEIISRSDLMEHIRGLPEDTFFLYVRLEWIKV